MTCCCSADSQLFDDFVGDEVFARGVGFDDGVDEVLRDFVVVGEELFGVFG